MENASALATDTHLNLPFSKPCSSSPSLCFPFSNPITASWFSIGNGNGNRSISSRRVRAEEKDGTGEREEDSPSSAPPKLSTGVGFGSPGREERSVGKKKTRGSVIRRPPVENPPVLFPRGEPQINQNENAFLLSWLALGFLIFVEGIALASSGFLPEEWDSFLVKYLYPSFTPTVLLFLGGTVGYGVLKYLGGEQEKGSK